MGLALGTAVVVLVVLVWELARPTLMRAMARAREPWAQRGRETGGGYDPGRERRAEQRARELLRSCVSEREWEMYSELGLICVEGPGRVDDDVQRDPATGFAYSYLIYPHKPIVAFVPETGDLLSE